MLMHQERRNNCGKKKYSLEELRLERNFSLLSVSFRSIVRNHLDTWVVLFPCVVELIAAPLADGLLLGFHCRHWFHATYQPFLPE